MKKALALILALLMLLSTVIVINVSAVETTWEQVVEDAGLTVHVTPAQEAPVLDGVVSPNEYTATRTLTLAQLGNPTEIQSDLVEYYAHDGNFIYYAATFTQANDNRAFWPQWKVDNTFAIFNDNSVASSYYHARVQAQMRYLADGSTYINGGITSNVATTYRAPVENTEYLYTAAKVDNVKTYEFKIAKSYFAELNNCSESDIRVMPYFISFHAAFDNQLAVSAEAKTALTELGATFLVDKCYTFIVLDGNTEAVTWESVVDEAGLTVHVDPVETAPVLDGVVSANEYSATRTLTLAQLGNPTEIQSDLAEYYAHDGDFIYYAATFTQANDNRAFWPQWKVDNTFAIFNDNTVTDTYYHARVQAQMRYLADGSTYINGGITSNHSNEAPTEGTEFVYAAAKVNNVKTYEFKIAKSYFAAINDCSESDIRVMPYFISFHAAFDNQIAVSAEAKAALTELGATFLVDKCYTFIVLDGETTATKPTDWEQVAEDNGFNIHVQPVTNTPVLDGVISENEYPTSRTTALADLSAGAAGELQGENVVEYFGHDAEYIYYAAVYTRASINRAFWPRFKMDNTFDIFNANYGQHVNVQLRLSGDPHTYQNGIGTYGSYTAPTFSSAVTYGFADVIAEAGRVDNVETFEVKIAKSYIAKANDITNDDVRVLPYYTWFHASTAVGNKMTAEQNAAITAAGGVAPAVGALSYNFMVLDGETIKVEDRLSITTNETASIRLSPSNAGIRFKSNVDTVDLIALVSKYGAENVKVGTLITLEEILGENELTADAAFQTVDVAATIATPFTRVDGVNTYAGSITNLNEKNYDKNFAARGYIAYRADAESEWTYIYSDVTALRSAAYVAQEAINSGNYTEDATALAILNQYLAVQAN